jgi:hypothetical protein
MSSQESVHDSPATVTPELGKGTLDTWRFHRQRGGRTQCRHQAAHVVERGCGQTTEGGVYANQRFSLTEVGRPMEERPRFQTGPGKSGRPGS